MRARGVGESVGAVGVVVVPLGWKSRCLNDVDEAAACGRAFDVSACESYIGVNLRAVRSAFLQYNRNQLTPH